MGIRRRGDYSAVPGQELKHFTGREDLLAVFDRLLDRPASAQLPVLMFYGVGGRGKSWLLKRLRARLIDRWKLPSAFIDFDPLLGGTAFQRDSSALLAEVWRQLDVECPRFELAFAMMRFKQGAGDRPLLRYGGNASVAWELVNEGGQALLNGVPGGNLLVWLGRKAAGVAATRLKDTALGKQLISTAGNDDYLSLSRKSAQEIYPTLAERLGEDLDVQLPPREGKSCRAVVFLDTFEALQIGAHGEAQHQLVEDPVRELYRNLTCVFLVIAGRDRLTWAKADRDWADHGSLEQHSLGGLSRHDATVFLEKCGILPGKLQEAIFRVCVDEKTSDSNAYHPYSLGLCADTANSERFRGREPDPATFDMAPDHYDRLARRFLKSLHDRHTELWIAALAQTPRFDEAAARDAFSPARDVHQDAAWETLRDYSFVQQASEPGWFRLHSRMCDALYHRLEDNPDAFHRAHARWQAYWRRRAQSTTDGFAALSWYHEFALDPDRGIRTWKEKVKKARSAAAMTLHFELLDWWSSTGIEDRQPRTEAEAAALNSLGNELRQTTLGNPSANLHRAIACYEAALRVRTEARLPAEWAMTQNNLGIAYRNLRSGDRGANLARAIACYEAALRVRTEARFPLAWAMTQNNLGAAYRNLPTGDRGAKLARAIACYEAALRVYTEAEYPEQWAMTQNNLGIAYSDLPTGDRSANLGHAIACFEAALRVYTESAYPVQWAMTENNLGIASSDLPTRDRGANLNRSVACYEAALRVYTEATFPVRWAMTQNNLGTACVDLPTGDRDSNLRRAIGCFEAALRVYTETEFPAEWAMTQNNLGDAHSDLDSGDAKANLACAIACYQAALRVYTETTFPAEWAMTQYNLGNAYRNVPSGDRDADSSRALVCFEAALRVYNESDFPAEWATTQNNLGKACINLQTGDRAAHLSRAIACFEGALRVYTEADFPGEWAMTQNNLGKAYSILPSGDRAGNLSQAVTCFEAALRIYTETDFPGQWAMLKSNLHVVHKYMREYNAAGGSVAR